MVLRSETGTQKRNRRMAMIDVKQAVGAAQQYLSYIFEGEQLRGLQVEEIELSEDDRFWYITLGWYEDPMHTRRVYKVFKIKSRNGEVVSMKIRSVN
jgi:hypothetical protein